MDINSTGKKYGCQIEDTGCSGTVTHVLMGMALVYMSVKFEVSVANYKVAILQKEMKCTCHTFNTCDIDITTVVCTCDA